MRKFIIFCEEHYNPLGMVRTLGEHGIEAYIIILRNSYKLIEKSKYSNNIYHIDTIEEGYNYLIKEFGNEAEKPVILTSDDTITGFLDEHYEEIKNRFIFYNAGKPGRIKHYSNKKVILDAASRNGLKTLPTVLVNKGDMNHGISYPIITKASDSLMYGWKSDMKICNSPQELEQAYKEIRSEKVLIQKFIEKKDEYCLDGISWNHGNSFFVAIASTYDYNIKGNYSPYMTIKNFENEKLENGLKKLFSEIGFEGIFSVEFLEDLSGEYYFSEINFRNSTWSYAATRLDMPLPILWEQAITGHLPVDYKKKIPDNFKAMVEFDDFRYRVRGHMVSFSKWCSDFRNAGCTYYSGYKDNMPFIYSVFYRTFNFIRKRIIVKR